MPSRILVVQHSGIRTPKTFGVFAAFLVAGSLILTGCTTDPEPAPTVTSTKEVPTPAPTKTTQTPEPTTPEPSAEPTPPDPALLINENTEEGAKSAATHFLDLQHYVLTTKNLEPWLSQISKDCQFCIDTLDRVQQLHDENLTYVGGTITKEAVNFAEEKWPKVWVVELDIHEDLILLQSSDGEIVTKLDESTELVQVVLDFNEGFWQLEELTN